MTLLCRESVFVRYVGSLFCFVLFHHLVLLYFVCENIVHLVGHLQIPEPGRRERLGLKMANEAAAKNRAKKQEALRRVTENLAR